MVPEIYQQLREKLDQYSCGFPLTESGAEFKILEMIFTEEEAEMFLNLTLNLETGEDIARRLGRDPDSVVPLLKRMHEKGNVFGWRRGEEVKYGAVPFILGLYEFQLNRMDRELAGLCEQYFNEALLPRMAAVEPLMRAIPINRSLEAPHLVATYEDSRAIIRNKKLISLARCICLSRFSSTLSSIRIPALGLIVPNPPASLPSASSGSEWNPMLVPFSDFVKIVKW